MDIEKKLKEAIYSLISEQADQDQTPSVTPKPEDAKPEKGKSKKKKAEPGSINIAPGSVGRGRWKGFIAAAGARAEGEPKKLMDDLGIKAEIGGSKDIDKVKNTLQRAINFNSIMSAAYAGATGVSVKVGEDEKPTTGIKVFTSEISTRDGIKFISHTLAGAKNAGMLNLNSAIEIGLLSGEIFIKEI